MKLEHTISKSCYEVFDYLTDMQKFVSVHPIIFRIDNIKGNEYLVFEKLKILFIPRTFTYVAEVTGSNDGKVVNINAVVMKMIHIHMKFILSDMNGKTHIDETVTFNSKLPVKFIMKGIFKKQHKQLFLNIEKA